MQEISLGTVFISSFCPFFFILFTKSAVHDFALLFYVNLSKIMKKTDVDFDWQEFCIKKGHTCASFVLFSFFQLLLSSLFFPSF